LADAVGIGEVTMGKVIQIDEHAPAAVREALDNKELSINQGYNITRQVRKLPGDEQENAAALAVEMEKAKKKSVSQMPKQTAAAKLRGCSAKPMKSRPFDAYTGKCSLLGEEHR